MKMPASSYAMRIEKYIVSKFIIVLNYLLLFNIFALIQNNEIETGNFFVPYYSRSILSSISR